MFPIHFVEGTLGYPQNCIIRPKKINDRFPLTGPKFEGLFGRKILPNWANPGVVCTRTSSKWEHLTWSDPVASGYIVSGRGKDLLTTGCHISWLIIGKKKLFSKNLKSQVLPPLSAHWGLFGKYLPSWMVHIWVWSMIRDMFSWLGTCFKAHFAVRVLIGMRLFWVYLSCHVKKI